MLTLPWFLVGAMDVVGGAIILGIVINIAIKAYFREKANYLNRMMSNPDE